MRHKAKPSKKTPKVSSGTPDPRSVDLPVTPPGQPHIYGPSGLY